MAALPDDEPGLAALASRAVDHAKQWGRAEVRFYKGIAADRGADVGVGIGIGIAALFLTQAAIVALLVGLVLMLTPIVGAGLATAIVVLVTFGIVGILAMVALGRIKRATRPLPDASA